MIWWNRIRYSYWLTPLPPLVGTLYRFPFYTHHCSFWRPRTEPLLQASMQEPAVLLVHWHVNMIQRWIVGERFINLIIISSLRILIAFSSTSFLSPVLVPCCHSWFPVTWLAALCSSFFPKVLVHTLNLLFWSLELHLSQPALAQRSYKTCSESAPRWNLLPPPIISNPQLQ